MGYFQMDKILAKEGIVHFWDLSNNFVILEDKFWDRIVKEFFNEYLNIAEGSRISGIPKTNLGRILRRERTRIRIKSLTKFVSILSNITMEITEKKIIWIGFVNSQGIVNPKLPFNFNSREGARILAAIANDGWISDGLYYSNLSQSLRKSVIRDAMFIFGGDKNTVVEWIKKEDQYLSFPSIIRDVFIQLTNFKGIKSETNPFIPFFVLNDTNPMLGWIEQTIADEGHVRFFPKKYRKSITWRRSLDVTNELKEFSFSKKEISIRKLPLKVQIIVSKSQSNLIKDETSILDKLGINFNIYNLGIYLTQNNKVRTRWEIQLTKKENLMNLRKSITIPDKLKDRKFNNMIFGESI
jgi:hypothetical protein